MKTKPVLYSPLLFSFLLSACAQVSPPSSVEPSRPTYEKFFDPWRACNHALAPAEAGERDAQDAFFVSAYVRRSQGSDGGEDLEQMGDNFDKLLATLGDDAFSKALQRQRPEVRSATREFSRMERIRGKDPKTYHILQSAPAIKWPH